MSLARVQFFSISLDGFGTGDQSLDAPFGHAGERLHEWMFATRWWHDMVGEPGGSGGIDDAFLRLHDPGIGAEIMGAGKFGPPGWHEDPEWKGWWGPNPPFHTPVFVLTHHPRPSIEMEGGTTYHFIDASPAEVLETAREAADGQDVRIGGGPTTIRDFLAAGLVDHMHIAVVRILLGRGVRLLEGLEGLEKDYEIEATSSPGGVTHVTFTRAGVKRLGQLTTIACSTIPGIHTQYGCYEGLPMSVPHALLALLSEGPKYGLRLQNEFESRTGKVWPLNIGQVYTTLQRLERDGLVESDGEGERSQKRYRITSGGADELAGWLRTPPELVPPPRDELVIKVLVALQVQGLDIHEILQAHRRQVIEVMQRYTRIKADATEDDMPLALVADAELFRLEAIVRWLDSADVRLKQGSAVQVTVAPNLPEPEPTRTLEVSQ